MPLNPNPRLPPIPKAPPGPLAAVPDCSFSLCLLKSEVKSSSALAVAFCGVLPVSEALETEACAGLEDDCRDEVGTLSEDLDGCF